MDKQEILQILNENIYNKLVEAGLSDSDISYKLKDVVEMTKKLGGDNWLMFAKNMAVSKFASILNDDRKFYKGIIVSVNRIRDEHAYFRDYTKSNQGSVRKNGYVVEEGKFPWGNRQGQPIPDTENWQAELIILVELNNDLVMKRVTYSNNSEVKKYLNKEEELLNKIVRFKVKEDIVKKEAFFTNYLEIVEEISEEKYAQLISGPLQKYKKKLNEALESKGFAVVENVAAIEIRGNNVIFNDGTIAIEAKAFIRNIDFIEGAIGTLVIGSSFESNGTYVLQGVKFIVSDEYKKVEVPENIEEVVQDNLNEEVVQQEQQSESVVEQPQVEVEQPKTDNKVLDLL